ncbi:hypothetical protein BFW01_g9742 [Lasiodiplodia theobromae]|nr:hypothetical protein BFW01_g9742 [Lasiodiplodia theobromae]
MAGLNKKIQKAAASAGKSSGQSQQPAPSRNSPQPSQQQDNKGLAPPGQPQPRDAGRRSPGSRSPRATTPVNPPPLPNKSHVRKVFYCSTPHTAGDGTGIPKDAKTFKTNYQASIPAGFRDELIVTSFNDVWVLVTPLSNSDLIGHFSPDRDVPTAGWIPFFKLTEGWHPDSYKAPQMDTGKLCTVVYPLPKAIALDPPYNSPPGAPLVACPSGVKAQIVRISQDGRWVQLNMIGNPNGSTGVIPSCRVKPHRWPCVVKTSYEPLREGITFGSEKPFPVKAGERGYIVRQSEGFGHWFHIALPFRIDGPRQGWVPDNRLTIHKSNEWGDFEMVIGEIANLKLDLGTREASTLYNTVKGLTQAFRNLSFLAPAFVNKFEDDKFGDEIALMMIEGMRNAGTFNIFSGGSFNSQALERAPKAFQLGYQGNSKTRLEGVYCIVYSRFPDGRPPHLYPGESVNMYSRSGQHKTNLKDQTMLITHYRLAKDSQKQIMVPVCVVQTDRMNRRILEQDVLCLVHGYNDKLLVNSKGKLAISKKKLSELEEIDTDCEDDDDNADEELESALQAFDAKGESKKPKGKKFTDLSVLTPAKRRAVHAEQAAEVQNLMNAVFKETGWKLPRKDWVGLNISTPLGETRGRSKTIWVKYDLPDRWQFRRSRFRTPGQRIQGKLFHSQVDTFIVNSKVVPEALKKDNAQYWLVVEIMKNSKKHPKSYYLGPDLGMWSDWEDTFTVGIKMEYESDGKWFQHYFQENGSPFAPQPLNKQPRDANGNRLVEQGSEASYAAMQGLRRAFLDIRTDSLPEWHEFYGMADVMEIVTNPAAPLSGQVILKRQGITRKPAPVRRSVDEIKKALIDAGATNVGCTADDFDEDDQAGMRKGAYARRPSFWRHKCDNCRVNQELRPEKYYDGVKEPNPVVRHGYYSGDKALTADERNLVETAGEGSSCLLKEGSNPPTCTFCWRRGLVCSFTKEVDLRQNVKLQKLLMPKTFINGTHSITEAQMTKLGLKTKKLAYDPEPEEIPDPRICDGVAESMFLAIQEGDLEAEESGAQEGRITYRY